MEVCSWENHRTKWGSFQLATVDDTGEYIKLMGPYDSCGLQYLNTALVRNIDYHDLFWTSLLCWSIFGIAHLLDTAEQVILHGLMGHGTANLRETGLFRILVWKRLFSAKTSWLIGSPWISGRYSHGDEHMGTTEWRLRMHLQTISVWERANCTICGHDLKIPTSICKIL